MIYLDKPFILENFNPEEDITIMKYKTDNEMLDLISNKMSEREFIQFLVIQGMYVMIIFCCVCILYMDLCGL